MVKGEAFKQETILEVDNGKSGLKVEVSNYPTGMIYISTHIKSGDTPLKLSGICITFKDFDKLIQAYNTHKGENHER